MKKIFYLLFLLSVLFSACSKDDDGDSDLNGLVQFSINPTFANDTITLQAEILFSAAGKATDIEIQILEGTTVLQTDTWLAATNVDGLGFSFRTDMLKYYTPSSTFSGKELTFWLDPENKVTSDEYTDETNVNLWKKETISIP